MTPPSTPNVSDPSLIFCCEVHGKIPEDQKTLFHDALQAMKTSPSRIRRRPLYTCSICQIVWIGPGNWLQAREHEVITLELGNKHQILNGQKPVTWVSDA